MYDSGTRRLRHGMENDTQKPLRPKLLLLDEAKRMASGGKGQLVSRVSDYKAARDGFPETYPGKRPPGSYLYLRQPDKEPLAHLIAFEDGNDPYTGHVLLDGRFVSVKDIFAQMNAPPMEELYMFIGYGSNPCPGQIDAKIRQARELGIDGIPDAMIVFRGQLSGYDPAVSSFFEGGYPAAGLIGDGRTLRTRCEVWANLMSAPMVKAMNQSEKVVDPYDPSRSDPNAEYAVADGYPFQIDGMECAGKPLLVNAAAYTARDRFYKAVLELGNGIRWTGPLAFDTLPAEERAFPETDVVGAFRVILRKMAQNNPAYEIDRLLRERGIRTVDDVRALVSDKVNSFTRPLSRLNENTKVLALMRWMNRQWRIIEDGKRPYADMELTNAVREHMAWHSDTFDMYAEKKEASENGKCRMFTRDEADRPESVRFGNLF